MCFKSMYEYVYAYKKELGYSPEEEYLPTMNKTLDSVSSNQTKNSAPQIYACFFTPSIFKDTTSLLLKLLSHTMVFMCTLK